MRRIDWMNVGKEHWEGNQREIEAIINRVKWQEIKPGMTMPFMQGAAINSLMENFKLPKASHVCDSHELAPFGLVGIRAHFKNADVDFFAVDEGTHISALCAVVQEVKQ
jgi:hypothetical protein